MPYPRLSTGAVVGIAVGASVGGIGVVTAAVFAIKAHLVAQAAVIPLPTTATPNAGVQMTMNPMGRAQP